MNAANNDQRVQRGVELARQMMEVSADLEPTSALKEAGRQLGIPYGDDMGAFVTQARAILCGETAPAMKVELRNIKHAEFASEETNCFSASLYINGVKRGMVSNAGHGGCNEYSDWNAAKEMTEYAKTLPAIVTKIQNHDGSMFEYQPDADTLVDNIVEEFLIRRDFQKHIKARILFTKKESPKLFQTSRMTAVRIAQCLAARAKTIPEADIILNMLPLEEAFKIYKERA